MQYISQILKLANNKVTVALSGGVDSISIAHFIKTKLPKVELSCFHFNHRLREQNNLMEIACRKFCQEFQITFSVKSRLDGQTDITEAGLRTHRYSAMIDFGYVITGHHLGDACENYMYNCLNGTPEYLPIPLVTIYQEDTTLNIIRPFILNTKQDFIDYATENNLLKFVVEDETNTDTKYRRNWLRHDILPQIKDKGYNLETIVRKKYMKYIVNNY